MEEWAEIVELEGRLPELTGDEEEKLAVMKHKFNLVLAADYQMGRQQCTYSTSRLDQRPQTTQFHT